MTLNINLGSGTIFYNAPRRKEMVKLVDLEVARSR